MCYLCAFGKHKGHDCKIVTDIANEALIDIQKSNKILLSYEIDIHNIDIKLQDSLQMSYQFSLEQKHLIQTYATRLNEAIRMRTEYLLNQCDAQYDKIQLKLNQQLSTAKNINGTTLLVNKQINGLISNNNPYHILQQKQTGNSSTILNIHD